MITPVSLQNSIDDELVISTARRCNKYTDKLVIFDARSMFAAGGNMLKVCCSLMQFPLYFETKMTFLMRYSLHSISQKAVGHLMKVTQQSICYRFLSRRKAS